MLAIWAELSWVVLLVYTWGLASLVWGTSHMSVVSNWVSLGGG